VSNGFSISLQILWFVANPLLVHVMGSKKNGNQGRNGCQSNLVVVPTPILVHRSGQLSCKWGNGGRCFIFPFNTAMGT
jgi:hypothetical protein